MATGSLKEVLNRVHSGRTVLPEFQRDFVWNQAAVIKLMSSIFNGYPIGSLLLMENDGIYQSRSIDGATDRDQETNDEDLILDGQQRVTSCYRAFYGTLSQEFKSPGRYYFRYGAYVDACRDGERPEGSSLEDFFEFIRPTKISRHLKDMSAEISNGYFPLDIIFRSPRGYSYSQWLSQYDFSKSQGEQEQFAALGKISSEFQTKLIETVTGYQINFEQITRGTNPDVICTIFETINTTGVKLTVFDLLVAKCFKNEIYLRDMLADAILANDVFERFDPEGKGIATTQLPRILGQLIRAECMKGVILALHPEDIATHWDRAVRGLVLALELIRDRYGVFAADYIPSTDIITPLAVILSDSKFHTGMLDQIDRWYWRIIFGGYLRGAPETKISRTLREIYAPDGLIHGGDALPSAVTEFQFRPSDIEDATKNSTVYRGIFSLLLMNEPHDIGVDRKKLSVKEDDIQDHHIFPQRYLRDYGIKGAKSNQILNRMPVLRVTNERISSTAPSEYIINRNLTHAEVSDDLEREWDADPSFMERAFSSDDYELFLMRRKEQFLNRIARAVQADLKDVVPQESL